MLFVLSRYSKKNSLNRFVSKFIPNKIIINKYPKIRLIITVYTYHYTSLTLQKFIFHSSVFQGGFNCFCLCVTTSIFVMICDVTLTINTNCGDVIYVCPGISTKLIVVKSGVGFETISNSIKLSSVNPPMIGSRY